MRALGIRWDPLGIAWGAQVLHAQGWSAALGIRRQRQIATRLQAPTPVIKPERQSDANQNDDRRDDGPARHDFAEQQRAERHRHDRIHVHATAGDDRTGMPDQIAISDISRHRSDQHQIKKRSGRHQPNVLDPLAGEPRDHRRDRAAESDLQRRRNKQIGWQLEPPGKMRAAGPKDRAAQIARLPAVDPDTYRRD